jgi:hypothetical protein
MYSDSTQSDLLNNTNILMSGSTCISGLQVHYECPQILYGGPWQGGP